MRIKSDKTCVHQQCFFLSVHLTSTWLLAHTVAVFLMKLPLEYIYIYKEVNELINYCTLFYTEGSSIFLTLMVFQTV